jgi:hypothetical protein
VANTLGGNLDTFSLADLLQWLEINALSGRVSIVRGDVKRTIDVKRGAIVYVSSSRPDERLGCFLCDRGLLPEGNVYELLAENFVTGKNLTRLIVEKEYLSRERLAEAVETLAIQILLDLFHWSGARFEFDPHHSTEDILRIHLSLRGQVLAFHGVKSVDESGRIRVANVLPQEEGEALWEKDLRPDALAGTFWSIIEALGGEAGGAGAVRERFYVFNLFAEELHRNLLSPVRPFPIFDDTAEMLSATLRESGEEPERVARVAALDPFFTADLLFLANALRGERKGLYGTARDAAEALGPSALRLFSGLLAGSSTPKLPCGYRVQRAVRRASLSTAAAASHLAEPVGMDNETAYTLGLLEAIPAHEIMKLLVSLDFPPGPFRGATLDAFRPLLGREMAHKLNLPRAHTEVLGSRGRLDMKSPVAERLVFFAKQMTSGEQIGSEWTSEDPALADRFAALASDPAISEKITRAASMLHELARL